MTSKNDEKVLGVISHVLGIVTGFVAPLIIYLIGEGKFVKEQARNALNWQISLAIYFFAAIVLSSTVILAIVAVPAMFGLGVMNTVVCILAAVKANEGRKYKYPLSIEFVK